MTRYIAKWSLSNILYFIRSTTMPEPWRFTVFSVVRGIFRSTWNKRFGFACCGECSTMIPRPFGLGIFCGGRYRTCTRSGLPFRSSCLPVQQEKEQQKSSSAEAELPGLRYGVNQRLLNWGARRAAFRPYFLRSFIRGSRVRKPAFFRTGRFSSFCCSRARLRPWRIAPA